MDFKQATKLQLYDIAYNDEEPTPLVYKRMAEEEILRRFRIKNSRKGRTNVRIKAIPAK